MISDQQKELFKAMGYHATRGATSYLTVIAILGTLIGVAVAYGFPSAVDATDKDTSTRSGLKLRIDYGTGCEYLESAKGFVTPRLGANGQPKCGATP